MSASTRGLNAVLAALVLWGLFPLYLRPLHDVPTLEIIAHRIVWSCLMILLWMLFRGELGRVRATLRTPALLWRLATSAILITANWLTYVYAVAHGQVLEASLGYFINPLVNIVLGVMLLSERLNRAQWVSVALATMAVFYLGVSGSGPLWIALTVALTFGLYGFVRKVIAVDALPGLAVETLLLLPIAAAYLLWRTVSGVGTMGHASFAVDALLVGTGAYTAIPLFLYAYGARLIPYSTAGLVQNLGPSLQLACGLLVFGETLQPTRAIGFGLIWAALAIFALDQLWRARRV